VNTLQEKRVKCGKGCKSCPHGPYLYTFFRVDKKLKSRYLGSMNKLEYLESQSEILCPISEPSMIEQKYPSLIGSPLFCMDVLGLNSSDAISREQIRKRIYNYAATKSALPSRVAEMQAAFCMLCVQRGWKTPRSSCNISTLEEGVQS